MNPPVQQQPECHSQPEYHPALLAKAKRIKLVVTDIDGVLSDGLVYLDQEENELKAFNIKDGLGIKWCLDQDIEVAVITGRNSKIVSRRMKELGVNEVHQQQTDKLACYNGLLEKYQITVEQVAYLGDDLPDLPLINLSGLGVTVADGHWLLKQQADWITPQAGGRGAFRDLAELLLTAQGKLTAILKGYQS